MLRILPLPQLVLKLQAYGGYVRSLDVFFADSGEHLVEILSFVPNIDSLSLTHASVSVSQLRNISFWHETTDNTVHDRLFVLLTGLRLLKHITWASHAFTCRRGRSVHVDDILRVLKANPQLTTLRLRSVEVAYSIPGSYLALHAPQAASLLPLILRAFMLAAAFASSLWMTVYYLTPVYCDFLELMHPIMVLSFLRDILF